MHHPLPPHTTQVHNATELPRVVLIVDIWHPQLETDLERLELMTPDEVDRYDGIIHRHEYLNTSLRGH